MGSFPMLTLMEPHLRTYLKGLGHACETNKRKETCCRRFLAEDSEYVSDVEVQQGEVNPETLLKLIRNVCEEETGYLHPQSQCSIKIPTKSLHLAYIRMFLDDL